MYRTTNNVLDTPFHVFQAALLKARDTAEQQDDGVILGQNESKQKTFLLSQL